MRLKISVCLLLALPCLAAENAVLKSGFRLRAERHEIADGNVRLYDGDSFVELPVAAEKFLGAAAKKGILGGIPLGASFPELGDRAVLVAVTERRTRAEIELYRDLVAGKGAGR